MCLSVLTALALAAVVAPTPAQAAVKSCGVRPLGASKTKLRVAVERGDVTCARAADVFDSFVRIQGDDCGGAMRPACRVGAWKCRLPFPGSSRNGRLRGYCFTGTDDGGAFTRRAKRKLITLSGV